jgi:hypothetical protein
MVLGRVHMEPFSMWHDRHFNRPLHYISWDHPNAHKLKPHLASRTLPAVAWRPGKVKVHVLKKVHVLNKVIVHLIDNFFCNCGVARRAGIILIIVSILLYCFYCTYCVIFVVIVLIVIMLLIDFIVIIVLIAFC